MCLEVRVAGMAERADTDSRQDAPGTPAGLDEAADGSGLESVAVGAALLTGFGIAGVLLALGAEFWWIGFPMIGGLVPLAVGLAEWYESSDERAADGATDGTEDALERLRERYARGELSEAAFERRLERLVETESVEEARRAVERRQGTEETTAGTAVDGSVTGTDSDLAVEAETETE